MEKNKRKSEQQSFYYETDRKPKKVVATLEKFWRRQQKQHNWKLENIVSREIIRGQLWHIETDRGFVYSSCMDADIKGQVFLENGKTIVNLSVSIIPVKSKYNINIFTILAGSNKYKVIVLIVTVLIALVMFAITDPSAALFLSLLNSIIFAWGKFREQSKTNALQKCQLIIEVLDNFAMEEEEKLEAEWEQLYGKAKNEDEKFKNTAEADEILQEKRK